VLLFSMSGVFHMTRPNGTAHLVMQRLDHGAIFVLIAGTFTPIHGLLFRGRLRWMPLLFIWIATVCGIVAKTAYYEHIAEWFGLSLYLAMGWFGVFSGGLLAHRRGFRFIRPLLFGGLAYSIGAIVDFLHWPVIVPGVMQWHEVFHLAVIAGALFHLEFVWKFADGEAIHEGNEISAAELSEPLP
jgi:channel protein (hemolysin III family)